MTPGLFGELQAAQGEHRGHRRLAAGRLGFAPGTGFGAGSSRFTGLPALVSALEPLGELSIMLVRTYSDDFPRREWDIPINHLYD